LTKDSANRPKKTAATPIIPVRSLVMAKTRGSRKERRVARRVGAMITANSSAAAANEPVAWGSRSGGVICMSSDKVAGMTRTAPSPVATRPAEQNHGIRRGS
jgi:hypothetical protein